MAEHSAGKLRLIRDTTPDEFTTRSWQSSSGDCRHTVELAAGEISNQLGRLTEAINTLKEQGKEHGRKLDELRMDVHAAKTGLKFIQWIVGVVGTLIALALAAYFKKLFSGQ